MRLFYILQEEINAALKQAWFSSSGSLEELAQCEILIAIGKALGAELTATSGTLRLQLLNVQQFVKSHIDQPTVLPEELKKLLEVLARIKIKSLVDNEQSLMEHALPESLFQTLESAANPLWPAQAAIAHQPVWTLTTPSRTFAQLSVAVTNLFAELPRTFLTSLGNIASEIPDLLMANIAPNPSEFSLLQLPGHPDLPREKELRLQLLEGFKLTLPDADLTKFIKALIARSNTTESPHDGYGYNERQAFESELIPPITEALKNNLSISFDPHTITGHLDFLTKLSAEEARILLHKILPKCKSTTTTIVPHGQNQIHFLKILVENGYSQAIEVLCSKSTDPEEKKHYQLIGILAMPDFTKNMHQSCTSLLTILRSHNPSMIDLDRFFFPTETTFTQPVSLFVYTLRLIFWLAHYSIKWQPNPRDERVSQKMQEIIKVAAHLCSYALIYYYRARNIKKTQIIWHELLNLKMCLSLQEQGLAGSPEYPLTPDGKLTEEICKKVVQTCGTPGLAQGNIQKDFMNTLSFNAVLAARDAFTKPYNFHQLQATYTEAEEAGTLQNFFHECIAMPMVAGIEDPNPKQKEETIAMLNEFEEKLTQVKAPFADASDKCVIS